MNRSAGVDTSDLLYDGAGDVPMIDSESVYPADTDAVACVIKYVFG